MGVVGLKSSQRLTGSSKMKVLAVLLLCGMAAAGGMGRDQKHMYKAWAGMKAMESCWGEENMKIHTINMKLAVSQCQQEDAPELNLPPFRSPYRFINTLMVSANRKEQTQMEFVYKMLQEMDKHQSSQYHSNHDNYGPYKFGSNGNSWTEKLVKRIAMKNAMKKIAEQMMSNSQQESMDFENMFTDMDQFNYDKMDYSESNSQYDIEKMMSMLFEDKMRENMMKYKMQQVHGSNEYKMRENNPFSNKNSYRQRMSALLQQRHKRQADASIIAGGGAVTTLPESLDLGDRLADKLKKQQEEMKSQVGNMTCVMRKMGVLNDQNELDINTQKKTLKKYKFESKWLKERTEEDMEMCNKMAKSLPDEAQQEYNFPGVVNLAQVKAFMNCCQQSKLRTCVFYDVKKKLETNFGSVDTILEQTNLTENQLFPLVMNLLYGDEMEYFIF